MAESGHELVSATRHVGKKDVQGHGQRIVVVVNGAGRASTLAVAKLV